MKQVILRTTFFVAGSLIANEFVDAQRAARVSVDTDGSQLASENRSDRHSLSADGRYVAFWSAPTPTAMPDVYVYDRLTGVKTRASIGSTGLGGGFDQAISSDGRCVAFLTLNPLEPNDLNGEYDIYVRDMVAGVAELCSVSSLGLQTDNVSAWPCLSADGSVVAFESWASTLVPGDTNGASDIFVRDRLKGTTVRASVSSTGAQADQDSNDASISDDGRFVAFTSRATNLVPNDTNGTYDIFVRDLQSGTTELVSCSSLGVQGNSASELGSISGDGSSVVFRSSADDLVGGVSGLQIFLRDRLQHVTTLVSQSTGGAVANAGSIEGAISGNGRFAVFASQAANLVAGDTNGKNDLFLRDLQAGTTERVSYTSNGDQISFYEQFVELSISADGRHVGFWSDQSGWIPGDTNQTNDAFEIDVDALAVASSYGTAKTSSASCVPSIGVNGIPYATGFDSFAAIATRVQNQTAGMFFWSRSAANIPFGGGTVWCGPPFARTLIKASGGTSGGHDCSGSFAYRFTQSYMASKLLAPGDTVFGQFWCRDSGFGPPNDIDLSDAIRFTIGN